MLRANETGPLGARNEDDMTLFGLVLAVGTAGLTMGVDLAGSEWRPSFMSAAELPAGVKIEVEFKPDGRITGSGGCNRFFGGLPSPAPTSRSARWPRPGKAVLG